MHQGMLAASQSRTGGGFPHEALSRTRCASAWLRVSTLGRRHVASRRLLFLVAAACVLAAAGASLASAAPIYTAWSAPVNLGPIVNSPVVPGSTGATGPRNLRGRSESLFLLHPTRAIGPAGDQISGSHSEPRSSAPGVRPWIWGPRSIQRRRRTSCRRSRRTATGCFSPGPRPAAPAARYLSVLPCGHPQRLRLADPDQRRRRSEHSHEQRERGRLLRQRRPPATVLRQR